MLRVACHQGLRRLINDDGKGFRVNELLQNEAYLYFKLGSWQIATPENYSPILWARQKNHRNISTWALAARVEKIQQKKGHFFSRLDNLVMVKPVLSN